MSEWNEILKQYEILGVESVIPIAHIRIRPDVRVLIDAYGNCGITGEPDYIPDKYPKGIRNPADQAKLFIATPKKWIGCQQ